MASFSRSVSVTVLALFALATSPHVQAQNHFGPGGDGRHGGDTTPTNSSGGAQAQSARDRLY